MDKYVFQFGKNTPWKKYTFTALAFGGRPNKHQLPPLGVRFHLKCSQKTPNCREQTIWLSCLKKIQENIIDPLEAAALLIHDGLSKTKYEYLKDLTDSKNLHLFPSWNDVKKERDKCVAKDATFNDDVSHASIYSTLENYLERLELDEDVVNAVLKIKEEYGENAAIEWVLIYKIGFDGSTQKPMKVTHIFSIFFLNFLNCINHTNIFFQNTSR